MSELIGIDYKILRLKDLVETPGNPQVMTDEELKGMADSMKKKGWLLDAPAVWARPDGKYQIISGHHRVQAGVMAGILETGCKVIKGITEEQAKILVVEANQRRGRFDDSMLNDFIDDIIEYSNYSKNDLFDEIKVLADEKISEVEAMQKSSKANDTLAEKFLVPPFSVLNARSGWWQDRKRAWIDLGIKSHLGRGAGLLKFSKTATISTYGSKTLGATPPNEKDILKRGGKYSSTSYTDNDRLASLQKTGNSKVTDENAAGEQTGTSIFDPVLCEIIYNWFTPEGAVIVDPFAGGSVRGIVAGYLGREYVGIDLRPEQVDANVEQWRKITEIDINDNSSAVLDIEEESSRPVMKGVKFPDSPGGLQAIKLYNATSSLPLKEKWETATPEMSEFLKLIYKDVQELKIESIKDEQPFAELKDNSTCWVAFTGGKDSVAAALMAEQDGYTPVLYYLKGLNRGMSDEVNYAQAIANKRGWKLIVDVVSISGKKAGFVELPTKNQVTALAMLSRMAESGGSVWSAGWHSDDKQENCQYGYDFTDGIEAIGLFQEYLDKMFINNKYIGRLKNETQAWVLVAENGLLNFVKGCVAPVRYKAGWIKANTKKFGELLPGRCGSCVKCAWEQMALERLNIIPPNEKKRKHGEKFLIRDMGEVTSKVIGRPAEISDIEEFLTHQRDIDKYWRESWPAQDVAEVQKYSALNNKANLIPPQWMEGNSLNIFDLCAGVEADFVFSCPPYVNLEQYSDDKNDLSNMDFEEFKKAYFSIIKESCKLLKEDRFACFVVGEVRDKAGNYYNFVSETIKAFQEAGLNYYNEIILVTAIGSFPIRVAGHFKPSRKIGKTHQNVLVFVKGDGKKAAEYCGDVEIPDLSHVSGERDSAGLDSEL